MPHSHWLSSHLCSLFFHSLSFSLSHPSPCHLLGQFSSFPTLIHQPEQFKVVEVSIRKRRLFMKNYSTGQVISKGSQLKGACVLTCSLILLSKRKIKYIVQPQTLKRCEKNAQAIPSLCLCRRNFRFFSSTFFFHLLKRHITFCSLAPSLVVKCNFLLPPLKILLLSKPATLFHLPSSITK